MLIDEIFEIMNKSILSNFDILKMTKFLGIKFNGVLMNDQLKPEYFKQTFFIILNFDNVGQSGIHWVALYNDIKFCLDTSASKHESTDNSAVVLIQLTNSYSLVSYFATNKTLLIALQLVNANIDASNNTLFILVS